MSQTRGLATGIFRFLLSFYPAGFRSEFGDEMLAVFTATQEEAGYDKASGSTTLLFREMRDWPLSVWRAYMEEMGSARMKLDVHTDNHRPTTWEMLFALLLFCIPIIANLLNGVPELAGILFLGTVGIALVFGLIKGFPRWSVPYLGFVISALTFLTVFMALFSKSYYWRIYILGPQYTWSMITRIFNQALQSSLSWFLTLVGALLVILLLMIWPRTRTLSQRIREDWTLLSFLLYGGVVFSILLAYDEYRYNEPWAIASWACLAAGAWVYMRLKTPGQRILALLAGVTLVYWITVVGKLLITPLQDWPVSPEKLALYSTQGFWSTLFEWVLVLFFLLAPALLTLLPRRSPTDSTPDETLIRA